MKSNMYVHPHLPRQTLIFRLKAYFQWQDFENYKKIITRVDEEIGSGFKTTIKTVAH